MLCSLHERTLHLLAHRPRNLTYEKIAEDIGINVFWIRAFARQKNDDPGVNKVQSLYEYLAGKSLDV